jgi:hypothetical protein
MQKHAIGLVLGLLPLGGVFFVYGFCETSWHSGIPKTETQLEGLKALADWAKWIVSLQMAVVGGLVIGILKGELKSVGGSVTLLVAAAVSFVVSIIAATVLMGQIPPAIERVSMGISGTDGFDMYSFAHHLPPFSNLGVQIRHLAGTVHTCFIAGVLFGLVGLLPLRATVSNGRSG